MGSELDLSTVETDADHEAWRSVRIAVLPHERCSTTEELKKAANDDRLMLLARVGGELVGSGMAQRGDTAGGMVAPRVLQEHRRRGYGTAILDALLEHLRSRGITSAKAGCDDDGSVAFAARHGFPMTDREVEQVRAIGDEPDPGPAPDGLEVVTQEERPELWAASYPTFGREVMADFALVTPLEVDLDRWISGWAADHTFFALRDGEVVGCAGLILDSDRPERAEHGLTAVSRDLRGTGLAAYLKRCTLHWAAGRGLREVYTWTQDGNTAMRSLNAKLGYADGIVSVTVTRDLSG